MIALHAIWSRESRLCVWGEDSGLPARAPARRGRPPVKPRPRAHPFACAVEAVAGALGRVCQALDATMALGHALPVLLPSFRDGPQASPHLLRADEDSAAVGRPDLLHPWIVPAAAFAPADAVEVLLGLPRADGPGIAVGDSLRFLSEVAKLALDLLARGRVLPALAWREDRWLARWEPVTIDPGDGERVGTLTRSMPPLLRAEVGLSEHGRSPEAVVADVLGAFIDACARRFLSRGLLSRRGSRGPRGSRSAGEAWLLALTGAESAVGADQLELAALAEQLDGWRREIERYAAHRTFRTCFRLSAPEVRAGPATGGADLDVGTGREPWRVEILLQAKDDPSVLVAAEDVWSSNGDGLRVAGRQIEEP